MLKWDGHLLDAYFVESRFRREPDGDRDCLPGLPPDHADLDLAVAGEAFFAHVIWAWRISPPVVITFNLFLLIQFYRDLTVLPLIEVCAHRARAFRLFILLRCDGIRSGR